MKGLLNKIKVTGDQTHEGFHPGSAVLVLVLLLAFVGTSFYLMLTNY